MTVKDAASPKLVRVERWILNLSAAVCHCRKYNFEPPLIAKSNIPKSVVRPQTGSARTARNLPSFPLVRAPGRGRLEHVFSRVATEDQFLQEMHILLIVSVQNQVLLRFCL